MPHTVSDQIPQSPFEKSCVGCYFYLLCFRIYDKFYIGILFRKLFASLLIIDVRRAFPQDLCRRTEGFFQRLRLIGQF